MAPIPVTIITGFLGAGKTTLINALMRDSGFAETAVLINEFGEVQIDHDLVGEFSDELIMTTTGCLCCTASSDIKQSLFDLWRKRKDRKIGAFRRVIVETTGLLDPVPVINSLLAPPSQGLVDTIVHQQFALSRVITLFDIITGMQSLENHPEAFRQIALADVVLLTKTDLARDPATLRDIGKDRRRLSAINPGAQILDARGDWPEVRTLLLTPRTYDMRTKAEDAIGWLEAESSQSTAHEPGHHEPGHDDHAHHDHDQSSSPRSRPQPAWR